MLVVKKGKKIVRLKFNNLWRQVCLYILVAPENSKILLASWSMPVNETFNTSELCFEFIWGTCCRKFCFRYVIFPKKLTSVYNDMQNNCSCMCSGGTYARMGIAWHEGTRTRDSHPEGNSLFTTFHFIGGLTGGVLGRKPTLSHLFQ